MHTVVDIGGQDVKVIEIENGMMKNFVMNDKCAAGTGRFLDVMARVLEVRVEDLGDLGDKSTKEIGISSTCTVFAESEEVTDEPPREMTKADMQREQIIRALRRNNGRRREAAAELFMSERTLYRKIKELGIEEN